MLKTICKYSVILFPHTMLQTSFRQVCLVMSHTSAESREARCSLPAIVFARRRTSVGSVGAVE
jgi:hypothetical protein